MEHKNVWEKYDKKQLKAVDELSDRYRSFLDKGKTAIFIGAKYG